MSAAALACLLLAAFVAVEWARPHLGATSRRLLVLAFVLLLAAGAMEVARWDHGHPDWLFAIGWIGAPVIVIFGAAAAGVRRWYGWPDLGPLPGRLALLGAAVLGGVLLGAQVKPSDVDATIERGETLRRAIAVWRGAHGGAWPARLEEAVPDAPLTRMGWVAPPPFAYDPVTKTLAFPIRTGAEAQVDLAVPGVPLEETMKPSTGTARRARLATTRVCLIVTDAICKLPWEEAVGLALTCASVGMVQLREKKLSDAAFLKRAKRLRAMCDAAGALLVLNDRVHLVAKAGADGVHLGEDDMAPLDARALLGPTILIGVSTHDAQLEAAPRASADYAGLGPCFPTATKTLTLAPRGAALLKETLPVANLPVFAIGGIDSDNVRLLVEAGADRIAVGAGILGRDDPATAARVLAAALDAHPRRVPRRKKTAKGGRGRHRTS